MSNLFSTYNLGNLNLTNRIVMAPMTRSRAINNVPNDLHAEYYGQRASAGLLITEGASPSPNGLGYARIPGIFTEEQIKAWKKVTDAVHEKGGKIVIQLMHTGRVTHPANLPKGASVLAPSAVKLESTKMWVDSLGLVEMPAPTAMTLEDIEDAINEYVIAAENAIRAGFDGVELHAANGYLIKQFINPHSNKRSDEYGGSIENRSRFLLEISERVADAIGKDKVGVRISPHGTFNEVHAYDETEATYEYIATQLNYQGIAYLHINDQSGKGEANDLTKKIRSIFKNTIILAGGFDPAKADVALKNNDADLIAFGRPFIPNPDLVERFKNNLPLNQPKFDLFYSPGAEGYVDYPVFEEVSVI
jgi:N-ethylmaleimide reductase